MAVRQAALVAEVSVVAAEALAAAVQVEAFKSLKNIENLGHLSCPRNFGVYYVGL